jgi:hypothetical protein
MHPRTKTGADIASNCDELPPAELIESLHLEGGIIDQHEFSRAEWFWRRRPGIFSTNVTIIFGYIIVAVCLFYYLPQTVLLLVTWIGAGASCVFADYIRLTRWRNEYQTSASENRLQPTKEQKGQIPSRSLGLEPNAQEFLRRHSKTTIKTIKQ